MNDLMKSVRKMTAPLAVDAAVSPAQHQAHCAAWNCTPFTRDRVAQEYGEQAALAWDDMRAAAQSFYRAVGSGRG